MLRVSFPLSASVALKQKVIVTSVIEANMMTKIVQLAFLIHEKYESPDVISLSFSLLLIAP